MSQFQGSGTPFFTLEQGLRGGLTYRARAGRPEGMLSLFGGGYECGEDPFGCFCNAVQDV